MSETWTAEEFRRFDQLTNDLSSPNQLDRIAARLEIREWERADKPKLDAMFEEIKRQDAKKRG